MGDWFKFWARVRPLSNGCWMWTAGTGGGGYGVFYCGKLVKAGKWAYTEVFGPVPDGLVLDHFVCDTPSCVSPWHVRPATQRENLLRGNTFQSANTAKMHCPKNHPYDDENTYHYRGRRCCRECMRQKCRRRRAEARARRA